VLKSYRIRALLLLALWVALAAAALAVDRLVPGWTPLEGGLTALGLVTLLAGILALAEAFTLVTHGIFAHFKRPPVEAAMVGRLYRLVGILAAMLGLAYGFGKLGTFASAFSLFGGMLLGWSLQAPVSGFAAWVLVSLKRPFRPGDRVQFPNLSLTGDVMDIGLMYTVLDQVGGSIGSEEAVGRHILVPNAMLFSQVVINYTVSQEAAYMLDEVVVRITYDSDWNEAERILTEAACDLTGDVVRATGVKPYIRSDLYDYGVYLRLRYQTRVKDRAETAYRLTKRIFEDIQKTRTVDVAIPFVYSFRAGQDRKDEDAPPHDKDARLVQKIDIESIRTDGVKIDPGAVEALAGRIAGLGLLQPILLVKTPDGDRYDVVAGHLRLAACKQLGWKTIPAIVRGPEKTD
jgi:small-conductance mechanosensitive channel